MNLSLHSQLSNVSFIDKLLRNHTSSKGKDLMKEPFWRHVLNKKEIRIEINKTLFSL